MKIFAVILNLPWSLIGLFTAILSMPKRVEFSKNPPAVIFHIRSFWWYNWLVKGSRGITNGNVIQTSDKADERDRVHELIHVEQFMRWPFIFAFMILYEQLKGGVGPQNNRFEKEAYGRSGSRYLGGKG
ncbi:MAG TPA: hypothetical protein VLE91_03895 [Candidatus Saccharimonadales bacterium]|nr:hypothetical protein [Candidatus Saccharimonadales bacterium]